MQNHRQFLAARIPKTDLPAALFKRSEARLWLEYQCQYPLTHRIHGAGIYGNMDPINIPPMLAYIPYMEHLGLIVDFPSYKSPSDRFLWRIPQLCRMTRECISYIPSLWLLFFKSCISPINSDKPVITIWRFPKIGVPPHHQFYIIEFVTRKHPFWVPTFWETPIYITI